MPKMFLHFANPPLYGTLSVRNSCRRLAHVARATTRGTAILPPPAEIIQFFSPTDQICQLGGPDAPGRNPSPRSPASTPRCKTLGQQTPANVTPPDQWARPGWRPSRIEEFPRNLGPSCCGNYTTLHPRNPRPLPAPQVSIRPIGTRLPRPRTDTRPAKSSAQRLAAPDKTTRGETGLRGAGRRRLGRTAVPFGKTSKPFVPTAIPVELCRGDPSPSTTSYTAAAVNNNLRQAADQRNPGPTNYSARKKFAALGRRRMAADWQSAPIPSSASTTAANEEILVSPLSPSRPTGNCALCRNELKKLLAGTSQFSRRGRQRIRCFPPQGGPASVREIVTFCSLKKKNRSGGTRPVALPRDQMDAGPADHLPTNIPSAKSAVGHEQNLALPISQAAFFARRWWGAPLDPPGLATPKST